MKQFWFFGDLWDEFIATHVITAVIKNEKYDPKLQENVEFIRFKIDELIASGWEMSDIIEAFDRCLTPAWLFMAIYKKNYEFKK